MNDLAAHALSSIRTDPQHHLAVVMRCRLLSSLGQGVAGKKRRTRLAILSIEKVLPIWDSVFPTDNTPRDALEVAAEVLAGSIESSSAQRRAGTLWTQLDDLSWTHVEKQSVILVGYGAVQAIQEALSEEPFGCSNVTEQTRDIDIDPYYHDSAYCASAAYSGGPEWADGSDAQRRLEFWTWWLTIAVPTVTAVD